MFAGTRPAAAVSCRAVTRCVVAGAVASLAGLLHAQEAVPTVGEPPPMYLAEPFAGPGLAGMPGSVVPEMLPDWPRWFAGASGLVMTRTLPSGAATMEPLDGRQLFTSDASATWSGGVDLHVGRWFGPRQHHAVEMIYWGLYNVGSSASLTADPPAIMAIPQAPGVTVSGTSAGAWLQDASGQWISRSDLVNDIEINWVYSLWERPEFLPRDRSVSLMWLAGFRFFQVGDTLTLATASSLPDLDSLQLGVATNNNIYGAQVGAKFDWMFMPRVRLAIVPKFMIGGNAITNTTSLVDPSGVDAMFAGGDPVNVHSTLGVFSWLGSVDTGVAWDITDRWSLSIGYRVVGVGNIAQADGQWPSVIDSPGSLEGIDAGSSTIVHGGFAGFESRY
jgi:hypothetical protein